MKRVLGVLLAAFIGVGAFVGIANAQAPDACGIALDALIEARSEKDAAQSAFDDLDDTVPNPNLADLEQAVTDAQTVLDETLPPILEFNVDVYTNLVPPVAPANVDAITPAILRSILADPQLGQGGQDEVNAALTAFNNLDEAQQALEDGQTIPNPLLKAGAVFDRLKTAKTAVTNAQAKVNIDCAGQPGVNGNNGNNGSNGNDGANGQNGRNGLNAPPQIVRVPVGGVATGDGSSL